MYILAIETTGAAASVALINEEGVVTSEETREKLNNLQNLMLMTEKLLDDSKLSIGDVTCIGVSEGPGSFTGIRIGVSTARALSQALNIQIISVPTLKTFVYNIDHYKGIICPIFDARRNQVYSCLLYTSDAADEEDSVDLGGRRIIKKKKKKKKK